MERKTPKQSVNALIIEFMFVPFKFTEILNCSKKHNSQHKRLLITHELKYTDVGFVEPNEKKTNNGDKKIFGEMLGNIIMMR